MCKGKNPEITTNLIRHYGSYDVRVNKVVDGQMKHVVYSYDNLHDALNAIDYIMAQGVFGEKTCF